MTFTPDPRCPAHPAYDVHLAWRPGALVGIWTCVCCGRPLGAVSPHDLFVMRPTWPQRRKTTPQERTWNGIDWDWMLRRAQG